MLKLRICGLYPQSLFFNVRKRDVSTYEISPNMFLASPVKSYYILSMKTVLEIISLSDIVVLVGAVKEDQCCSNPK